MQGHDLIYRADEILRKTISEIHGFHLVLLPLEIIFIECKIFSFQFFTNNDPTAQLFSIADLINGDYQHGASIRSAIGVWACCVFGERSLSVINEISVSKVHSRHTRNIRGNKVLLGYRLYNIGMRLGYSLQPGKQIFRHSYSI